MDSINANQPEDNRENLSGAKAIEKIRAQIDKVSSCFFCTAVSAGGSGGSRPMSVQKVDSEGNLWFMSATDSHKNQELAINPAVSLFFQGSAHSDFMHITGTATVS
jgi:general stress protein 26